jgi:hypothetical protein
VGYFGFKNEHWQLQLQDVYIAYYLAGKKAHLFLPRGPKAKRLRQKVKIKQASMLFKHWMRFQSILKL